MLLDVERTAISHNPLESIKKGMGNLGYEFKGLRKVEGSPHDFVEFIYKGHDVLFTVLNAGSPTPKYQLRNLRRQWVEFDSLDMVLEEALILSGILDLEPIE